MVFSEKFAHFANSGAYFSWIIFINFTFVWLKPRFIENHQILAKNPKNWCLKFSDLSTKSGSKGKGCENLKLNVPNFGPFCFPCYFRLLAKSCCYLLFAKMFQNTNLKSFTIDRFSYEIKPFQRILVGYFTNNHAMT